MKENRKLLKLEFTDLRREQFRHRKEVLMFRPLSSLLFNFEISLKIKNWE